MEREVGIVEVRMATELYQMSAKTVSKVILHATKYAHGEVCGCLLGRQEEHTVIVEDCIPFFHKAENKHSPLLEVALAQVRSIDIMRIDRRIVLGLGSDLLRRASGLTDWTSPELPLLLCDDRFCVCSLSRMPAHWASRFAGFTRGTS